MQMTAHVHEEELDGGQMLRVASIERPHGADAVIVERGPRSDGPFALLDPGNGERVTLTRDAASHLRRMLGKVGGDDA